MATYRLKSRVGVCCYKRHRQRCCASLRRSHDCSFEELGLTHLHHREWDIGKVGDVQCIRERKQLSRAVLTRAGRDRIMIKFRKNQ